MNDYKDFKRDPETGKLIRIDPSVRRRSGHYRAPKRAKGMGLTSEHKMWLWKNWKYDSSMTFDTIARQFNTNFSDMTLKKVDFDIMKRYRGLGGETDGLDSYLNNKPFSEITQKK